MKMIRVGDLGVPRARERRCWTGHIVLRPLTYDATLGGHAVDTSRRKVGDSSCPDSLALVACRRTHTAAYKSATNRVSALSRFVIATSRTPV
jgi:hypothetical protein